MGKMKWKPEFFKDVSWINLKTMIKVFFLSIIYIIYVISITSFQLFIIFGEFAMKFNKGMYDKKNQKVYKGEKYNKKY